MTAGAWAALAVAGGAAAVDWGAVARRSKRVEYAAKPLTVAALLVAALLLEPDDGAQQAWFVAALGWSLLGDVFLMLPRDRFVPGLASFLVAHLAYLPGMALEVEGAVALGAGAVAVAAVAVTVGRRLLGALRRSGRHALVGPVAAYVVAISAMVAAAVGTLDPVAVAGALLFMGSDLLIGWHRFVRELAWAPVTIIVTYHLGQAALVLSLVS